MKPPFQNHIPLEPGMVTLLGIPWDENSSFLRGPALAPARIRKMLRCGAAGTVGGAVGFRGAPIPDSRQSL